MEGNGPVPFPSMHNLPFYRASDSRFQHGTAADSRGEAQGWDRPLPFIRPATPSAKSTAIKRLWALTMLQSYPTPCRKWCSWYVQRQRSECCFGDLWWSLRWEWSSADELLLHLLSHDALVMVSNGATMVTGWMLHQGSLVIPAVRMIISWWTPHVYRRVPLNF